jgi:hypothetical protein
MPMSELLIRPTHGDHLVLEDLLAPSPVSPRRSIDGIVLCAHDAARDERLLEAARKSGAPLLVDPLTMLLQDPVDPDDPWVRLLPFGRAEALRAEELSSPFVLDEIVAQTVEFQVERGATTIIPPYFYAEGPDSPAFAASLAAIGRTARRMRADGVSLPLMPLLCAQLRGFTAGPGWRRALERFAAAAIAVPLPARGRTRELRQAAPCTPCRAPPARRRRAHHRLAPGHLRIGAGRGRP